jgi:protease-4
VSRHSNKLVALGLAVVLLMTLAGIILAVVLAGRGGDAFALGGRIALIELDGVLGDDREYLEQIRRFREDSSVKGYVLAINSPGGVVGPAQSLYRELKRLSEEDGEPVVASIGGVGASGGYYVALAADSIFALPGSITGSIGVLLEVPNASELMAKIGVQVDVVKSAEHKDAGSPFRPLTPEDREMLAGVVVDLYEQFVEVVATERNLDPDVVRRIADGRILSGRQALEYGLVDRIGNLHDALAAAGRMAGLGERPRVVRPPRDEFTLLDLILGRGTTGALGRLARSLGDAAEPRLKYAVPYWH